MLMNSLKRKSLKKLTVSGISSTSRNQFNCHESVLVTAFAGTNVIDMDAEQLSILILSHRYNITYDSATGNIIMLMPLL